MMKNLILVIGRSGAGKDTLVRAATEVLKDNYKIVSVPSYTDRPIRVMETNGVEHTFLTAEQFDELLNRETIFAYTKIGDTGYRYCSTVEMLERLEGDTIFYIIDLNGYYYCSKFKDKFNIKVVYVKADEAIREHRANKRNGDSSIWQKRNADEDEQFTRFEELAPWDACILNDGDLSVAVERFVQAINNLLINKRGA